MENVKIGNKLKELRILSALTQTDVANVLGCKRQTYTRYENDQREVDLSTLCALADLFGVSTDYILGREDIY